MKPIIRDALILSLLLISGLCLLGRAEEEAKEEAIDESFAATTAESEAVFTLTNDSFDAFIADNAPVLVEFYAPWCQHCKELAPIFEETAQSIARGAHLKLHAKLAKVDVTRETDLAARFGVHSLPTLKYFAHGDASKPVEFKGGRTTFAIMDWLVLRSVPAVALLESAEAVEAFRAKHSVALIGFFSEQPLWSHAVQALSATAEAHRDSVSVGRVASANVTSATDFEFGRLYLFRDFDFEERVVAFDGALTAEGIAAFLSAQRFPLITAISEENYGKFVDRGLPIVWASLDGADDRSLAQCIEALTPWARELKGQLSFAWIDAERYAPHIQGLGITATPGLLIEEPSAKKFLFDGALKCEVADSADLKAFFDGYAAGTLEAHRKSEAVPATNDGAVFVLVASEFESVVNGERAAMVEFYAPWCGHCKALAPEYERVGAAFAGDDSVVIAKADATANDFPADISGFPTLLFYAKGADIARPIAYDGAREHEAIVAWIKTQMAPGGDDREEVSDAAKVDAEVRARAKAEGKTGTAGEDGSCDDSAKAEL